DLESLKSYPRVLQHLTKFKAVLSERREVENGRIKFFQLQWPRNTNIFTGEKIVVPYRSNTNAFAYNKTEWFCRSDCYVITQKYPTYALGYLLALLNSSLYFQWLFHRGKRKGQMLELFQIPLSEIPIKRISGVEQKPFIDLTNRILAAKRQDADTKALELAVDKMIYDLYGLSSDESDLVLESSI
ncbi:MAG TPA: TaqI-like C-terminal specificity domain-containing protein, partial [Acetobacteraceae bacterium]|nr:TaqI-like C-terminal specificity domain-containing protein [Acetobacteraceae bacterium]